MIVSERKELGFNVGQVTNIIIEKNNELVDTEKTEKVKDIFKLQYLTYYRVNVEEPHERLVVVQFQRCQQYGKVEL